jgi:hypothetical protein
MAPHGGGAEHKEGHTHHELPYPDMARNADLDISVNHAALEGHDVPALRSCVAGLLDTRPGPPVGTVLIVALGFA